MSLEDRQKKLLDAIQASGDQWLKRADIAKNLGNKPRLSHADSLLLELLEQQGLIESRAIETNAPSGKRWEYRIKQQAK